ncbi:hypothetical protein JX265_000560 [Neoarthrinium moseri]|uniref:FXYD domain-containing ion transport regulator n=1 Tax=Neoarthrinium moseri TaxID=1658444 RepID=A0A9P9WYT6_9PEZI|nr:hypothetical protein JX266_001297 [Neoarthrinium moseri]KAI1881734.1 hypothetical protein JX265_000560 [Neoarthrinium moseri]
MKASIALCALSASSWAFAAPLLVLLQHAPPKSTVISSSTAPHDSSFLIKPEIAVVEDAGVQDVLETRPDNRPYSPSDDETPSKALASPRPLKTAYLLSLQDSSDHVTEKEQPPSQAVVPDSSIIREETGKAARIHLTTVELETEGNKPLYDRVPCKMHAGHFYLVRRYADMTLVTTVLIFIAIVALIEIWSPMCRTIRRVWYGEGRIRLEDEECEKEQLKRRHPNFVLLPAPKACKKSKLSPIAEKFEEL